MDCADQERCQEKTPEKFIACVEDDCHHCADCFKFTQTEQPEELAELRRKLEVLECNVVACHQGRDILASIYEAMGRIPACGMLSILAAATQEIQAHRDNIEQGQVEG